jgi:hypothetical protein
MVVHKRDTADYNCVGTLRGSIHEFLPDEITKRFGTVRVSSGGDVDIELIQQIGIDGHTDPA